MLALTSPWFVTAKLLYVNNPLPIQMAPLSETHLDLTAMVMDDDDNDVDLQTCPGRSSSNALSTTSGRLLI